MHHPRFYKHPASYNRGVAYGDSVSQMTRSTYKSSSSVPFSPRRSKYLNQSSVYGNPRFIDRSKYVWTANKNQNEEKSEQSLNLPQQEQKVHVNHFVKAHLNNTSKVSLAPLAVTALDTAEVVVRDIASKLLEEKIYLIRKVVEIIGVKRAIKLYYETRQKEANGGILVQNGKRRRTPGGVFLTLLRETSFISQEEATKVFDEIKQHELQMKIAHFR